MVFFHEKRKLFLRICVPSLIASKVLRFDLAIDWSFVRSTKVEDARFDASRRFEAISELPRDRAQSFTRGES